MPKYTNKIKHRKIITRSRSKGNWSNLPSLILEIIYGYLDRPDQLNMSLVCRNWSNEYKSTFFWKTIYLRFSKQSSKLNIWPDFALTQKYGSRFEHIEINGEEIKVNAMDEANLKMNLFFEALNSTNVVLRSINIKKMQKQYLCSDFMNQPYSNLLQSILNFISMQKNLVKLEFNYSHFYEEDALDLLILLFEGNFKSLKELTLKQIIGSMHATSGNKSRLAPKYKIFVKRLVGLNILIIDFSPMFENIIYFLSTEKGISTQTSLKIVIHSSWAIYDPPNEISPATWKQIKEIYPNLRVHMSFSYLSLQMLNFSDFIADNMPLQHLEIQPVNGDLLLPSEKVSLFQQICNCKAAEQLRYVSIVSLHDIGDITNLLIPFLQASRKLETLKLFLRYPVNGIKDILKSMLKDRPVSLKMVYLTVAHVVNEFGYLSLLTLADEYRPQLQNIGLKLVLIMRSCSPEYEETCFGTGMRYSSFR